MKRDNQNRDLEAFKRRLEKDEQAHEAGAREAHAHFLRVVEICPLADWTVVNNVKVLRSGDSRFVGVPCGTRNKNYHVLDLRALELVTVLSSSQIYNWLWRAHQAELEGT